MVGQHLCAQPFPETSDTVMLLLESGADTRTTNERGRTALDYARAKDHARIVEILTGRL